MPAPSCVEKLGAPDHPCSPAPFSEYWFSTEPYNNTERVDRKTSLSQKAQSHYSCSLYSQTNIYWLVQGLWIGPEDADRRLCWWNRALLTVKSSDKMLQSTGERWQCEPRKAGQERCGAEQKTTELDQDSDGARLPGGNMRSPDRFPRVGSWRHEPSSSPLLSFPPLSSPLLSSFLLYSPLPSSPPFSSALTPFLLSPLLLFPSALPPSYTFSSPLPSIYRYCWPHSSLTSDPTDLLSLSFTLLFDVCFCSPLFFFLSSLRSSSPSPPSSSISRRVPCMSLVLLKVCSC